MNGGIRFIMGLVWDAAPLAPRRAGSAGFFFATRNIHNLLRALPLLVFLSGCYEEKKVPVRADFEIEYIDRNFSVPVNVKITNKTVGAETYTWTFSGAVPGNSAAKHPGAIRYDKEGNYVIR